MTKLFDDAVETARRLPSAAQDEIARLVFSHVRRPSIVLTPEEDADLAEADAEVARGELASEEEMRAIWAKYSP